MNDKLEFEAIYPHSPDEVWRAITDPEALSRWFLPTDFRPLIGLRFRFEAPERPIDCRVLKIEEGRQVVFSWRDRDDEDPSFVTWTLEPVDGGTRLTIEHQLPEEPVVTILPVEASMNWRAFLRRLFPVPTMVIVC